MYSILIKQHMRPLLFLLLLSLACSTISAQQFKIELTQLSFSEQYNFSSNRMIKLDSSLFFRKEKGFDSFVRASRRQTFFRNNNKQPFDYEYGNMPTYTPIDKIDNYRYMEYKRDKECLFCGDFEVIFVGW